MIRRPPRSTLFPTRRSSDLLFARLRFDPHVRLANAISERHKVPVAAIVPHLWSPGELTGLRSEEHTSELQSLAYLVCRLLLEKKKRNEVSAVACSSI